MSRSEFELWTDALAAWSAKGYRWTQLQEPARLGRVRPLPPNLHSRLANRLVEQGYSGLYGHQIEVFQLASAGTDIVVATGTNSGKSLCYNLPVIDALLREPRGRAIYLYPTKALANDQCQKLQTLTEGMGIQVATLDGDTPTRQRGAIRRMGQILLTNPDFLHVSLLPNHERWAAFLRATHFLILDEVHAYRGIFGSHVAHILRRLLRLTAWQGSRPVVIGSSATIGNPRQIMERLTSRSVRLVENDESPQGRRTYAFLVPSEGSETIGSPNRLTARLLVDLCELGVRTLAFSRSRAAAELVLRYARDMAGPVLATRLESYRAGYLPEDRRRIEKDLLDGNLIGLSSTNALELGIDVGGLDAVIMNGYPGTISGFFQQAGRAGRGERPGLCAYIPHDDPLQRYVARNPDTVLKAEHEQAAVKPENPHILSRHLLCAAYERPLDVSDVLSISEAAKHTADTLVDSGELAYRQGLWFYPSHTAPATGVSIRGISGKTLSLVAQGETLGTMEGWRALRSAHEGAIYLHRGRQYLVAAQDGNRGKIELMPTEADYYTQPMVQSLLQTELILDSWEHAGYALHLCGVRATETVVAFQRKSLRGGQVLSIEELAGEPYAITTVGVRLDVPLLHPWFAESEDFNGGLHAVEHALRATAPLLAGCDPGDLASGWMAMIPETQSPAVYVYDVAPGGVGLAEALFAKRDQWLEHARALLASCICVEGCPDCVMLSTCPDGNRQLSKAEALVHLHALTATES